METLDDLTPLGVDSESPEIVSVSSCSVSLSTSTIAPRDNPETLMSLLLQIQQFHSAETQKLHEKVNKWKTKCVKLADISNNNADSAKKYYEHNKLLVIEITELKNRLKALQRQSGVVGIQSETAKPAHPPIKEAPGAELSNKPGNQDKGLHNKVFQNEAQSKMSSKPLSKLTSKKSRKKVWYSEIKSGETFEKVCEMTAHVNPEAAKIRPFGGQKYKEVKVVGTPQAARILAPDTCPSPTIPSPSCKMNPSSGATPSGHGKTNPAPTGPRPWIKQTGPAFTIPETLGMGASDVSISIDLTDEDLCAPAYESTPVFEKQNISTDIESSKDLRENRFIQDPSMKKLFPETPVGRKLLVTSMPKSESQYPVDLFNTQVKSPTFCGESVMTTPRIADSSLRHGSKSESSPLRGDHSDMCAFDDTCESEDSILLLSQREKVSAPKAVDSEVASRSKSDQENQREENTTSRDAKETTSAEVQNETTPAKDLRMSNFKKRRYSPGDLSNSLGEETVLQDAAELGTENSPDGLDDLSSLTSPSLIRGVKQIQKEGNRPEKMAATMGKVIRQNSLKQSKLSISMFKPGVNRPLSLMQKYNGGNTACTHVDSQSDTFLNQAIELSLVEQKASVHDGTERTNKPGLKRRRVDAAVSQSEDPAAGFKIPGIPHQKKQTQLGGPTPNTENREYLPHSLDFTSTPHDLNGSVDPLMDLTRLESDGASSPGEMDLSRQEEHPRSGGRGDSQGQEAEFGSHVGDEGNDSCVDLFQEDRDEEDYEEAADDEDFDDELDRSLGSQGVTGYINNFDKVPEKNDLPNYKYMEVVRKRDDRQKLKGFGCKECDQFYGNLELTDAEREVRIKECSRHRAKFNPPNTPEHYWSVDFPDTQTCIERGYINAGGCPDGPIRKRNNKYNLKRISGREVVEVGIEMDG